MSLPEKPVYDQQDINIQIVLRDFITDAIHLQWLIDNKEIDTKGIKEYLEFRLNLCTEILGEEFIDAACEAEGFYKAK